MTQQAYQLIDHRARSLGYTAEGLLTTRHDYFYRIGDGSGYLILEAVTVPRLEDGFIIVNQQAAESMWLNMGREADLEEVA